MQELTIEKIGLVETIDALRSELAAAVEKAHGQEIQLPIGSVQLEFQVGVTWDTRLRIANHDILCVVLGEAY